MNNVVFDILQKSKKPCPVYKSHSKIAYVEAKPFKHNWQTVLLPYGNLINVISSRYVSCFHCLRPVSSMITFLRSWRHAAIGGCDSSQKLYVLFFLNKVILYLLV